MGKWNFVKILGCAILLCQLCVSCRLQVSVLKHRYADGVVTVQEAGRVRDLLGKDYLNITSLKVVGPVNGDDVDCLRQMLGAGNFEEAERGKLTTLDLSESTLTEGGKKDTIGKCMFSECANLQHIVLPAGLSSIELGAFYNCTSLTSVVLPDSLTTIELGAFFRCTSLTSIDIPDGVTTIGRSAFANCTSLSSVRLGAGVASIDKCAFQNCSSITDLYCHATTPPDFHPSVDFWGCSLPQSLFGTFPAYRLKATLHIPQGCRSAYRGSIWYEHFKDMVEME